MYFSAHSEIFGFLTDSIATQLTILSYKRNSYSFQNYIPKIIFKKCWGFFLVQLIISTSESELPGPSAKKQRVHRKKGRELERPPSWKRIAWFYASFCFQCYLPLQFFPPLPCCFCTGPFVAEPQYNIFLRLEKLIVINPIFYWNVDSKIALKKVSIYSCWLAGNATRN